MKKILFNDTGAAPLVEELGEGLHAICEFDGITYYPADKLRLAGKGTSLQDAVGAILLLSHGTVGIQLSMPPEAMRSLANQLILLADSADRQAVAMAGEAITRAQKPRT